MSFKCLRIAWLSTTKSAAQKLVLVFLADHADVKTQKCWHAIQTIAKDCHLSKRAVYRAIKELSELGLIKIESGGGKHHTNTYFVPSNGDSVAPLPKQTVTNRHANGDGMAQKGDYVAPQSSVIRNESKGERNGKTPPYVFDKEFQNRIKLADEEIERIRCKAGLSEVDRERISFLKKKQREWRDTIFNR